jgi:hypothetical protein
VPSHRIPSLALSLILHLILLIGIVWVGASVPKGTTAIKDRQIGIAMVHQLPDRQRYEAVSRPQEKQPESTDRQRAADVAAAASPPADLSPPLDVSGILQAMESTPAPRSGSGLAGDARLDGDAFGSEEGASRRQLDDAGGTTRLFGVSGSGRRFVYVFDRSDSMNGFGGMPLRSAKRELIRSLNSLSPRQQFQIIFYNENVKPFQLAGSPLTMVAGEPQNLRRAERYVEAIRAFGGTKHKNALLMALRMSPDVVFFLTDAHLPRLSRSELERIQDRAQGSGTTIHAIEFGSKPVSSPDSFLRELASMNGGQYQYVDVRTLGSRTSAAVDEKTE